jgi:bifunctional non-homologous end joining protein LigD
MVDRPGTIVAVPFPQSLVPMQPMLGKPFHRPGWVYEEKYDGWRMLAFKDGLRVRLISRQGVDYTERFRELAAAVAALKAPTLILDGEVCVFDKNLISQFHLLDRSVSEEPCTPPVFMAFDCLHVHGLDVRGLHSTAVARCSSTKLPGLRWSTPPVVCQITDSPPGLS